MPNWRKVLVSGSDAALNSLTVTANVTAQSFTGSLLGTASWAQNALTASFFSGSISNAVSSSYAATASWSINSVSASYALTASNSQNASDILLYVKNISGAQINKGTVVRISGSLGDNPLVAVADWTDDNNSANTLGLVTDNIPNDSFGYVMTEGTFIGYDTLTPGWTAGQVVYLGSSGSITGSAPRAPLHTVRLGQVLRVQEINGSIYVRIDNGYELGELHDIIDNTTNGSYGDLLVKSGSVWTNSKQLTGSYGLTGSIVATQGFTGSLLGTSSNVQGGATNYITLWNGATTLSSSVMYQSASSIGVGTIVPSYTLDVNGSFRSSGIWTTPSAITFWGGGTTATPIAFGGLTWDTGYAAVYAVSGNALRLGANGRISNPDIFINTSGNVGISTITPNAKFDVNGNTIISGSLTVTGSINAQTLMVQTITSSVEFNSGSTIFGTAVSNTHQFTGSVLITGSLNVVGAGITGSLFGTSSWATNAVSASYSNNFTVANQLTIDATLTDYATVASSTLGSNNVFTQATGSYTSAFFKYTVASGSNTRAGEVVAAWNAGTSQFYDNSTLDIGNTLPVTSSVSIVAGNLQFNIQTNTPGWRIKSLATYI